MSSENDNDDEAARNDVSVYVDSENVCNKCNAEFLDHDDFRIHLHQVHNIYSDNERVCQFCSAYYTDLMAYAIHIRDEHITKLKLCQYCSKAFKNNDDQRRHENKHTRDYNKSLYKCSQCDSVFGNVLQLKTHEYDNHNNNIDGILLTDLYPYLSVALNIKASTFLQFIGKNTIYICVGCNYTSDDAEMFIDHARNSNCRTYVCHKCSNTYNSQKNIQRHVSKDCVRIRSHEKMKKCPVCNMQFNRTMFKGHERSCTAIKCYICEVKFSTMYELSEHQSKEHPLSIEVTYCKYCRKQFVGNVALQKHVDRTHKPEFHLYKYLCVHCNNVYKHPQKLFGHFFTKHKEINPYTCKICNINFRLRKKFTIHIKLDHQSNGFVEFDENYNVFFTSEKSANPFIPKSIYKEEDGIDIKTENDGEKTNKIIDCIKLDEVTTVTETEGNQTEVEMKPKRRRPTKVKKAAKIKPIPIESSDDEPLVSVKNRIRTPKQTMPSNKRQTINKQKFTCQVCKKYCYTYQNYCHHMSLHSKKDVKKCIKCDKVFKSKAKLSEHVTNDHSTSKLTETLKSLLEKRKSGICTTNDVSMSDRFRKTIKKVKLDISNTSAKIKPVEVGLSVQKFIENFTPEETRLETNIRGNFSLKVVSGIHKKPSIKMTKFDPKPIPLTSKLSMPVKFKDSPHEKANVTIKLVDSSPVTYEDDTDYVEDYDHNESIPEVAQEVLLEGTEETPKPVVRSVVPHKVIIDKIPKEYKDMRIATLLPKAPFYKILKVNDVLEPKARKTPELPKADSIKLPDGTKLVSSNPLAHLLGDKVDKVLDPNRNKYYKPKVRNFQDILAEALSKLDKPTMVRKKKKVSNDE